MNNFPRRRQAITAAIATTLLLHGISLLLAKFGTDYLLQHPHNTYLPNVLPLMVAASAAAAGFTIYMASRWRYNQHGPITRIDRPDFAEPTPAPPPAQQPIVINMQPAPAPAQTASPWPAPQPPQRPVLASDFQEPEGHSIFDPLPADVPSYKPRRSQYAQPAFDPLAYAPPPLQGLEQEERSAPWDDVTVTFDGPLHSGPLLERRPPRAGEIDTIRDIYAETGSLNKTIQRVYGAKDARTHGWVKGALEL